jgi:hypothetical protein
MLSASIVSMNGHSSDALSRFKVSKSSKNVDSQERATTQNNAKNYDFQ